SGDETPFSSIIGSVRILAPPTTRGHILIWNDTAVAVTTYWRNVDSAGNFLESPYRVSDMIMDVVALDTEPRYMLLYGNTGAPILIDADGNEKALDSNQRSHFTDPYYIAKNGMLVSTSHDTVRIYRSFLDNQPERITISPVKASILIPAIDSLGRIRLL